MWLAFSFVQGAGYICSLKRRIDVIHRKRLGPAEMAGAKNGG
jgi:hypothetical protein